jgi:hypothetical protein
VSNYAKTGFLYDGEDAVVIGPETVNGTGQVYLDADAVRFLSNAQARELGRALIEAAEYAEAVQNEKENWPLGSAPKSVLSVEWTDPQWRAAGPDGDPDTRCGAAHRTEHHGVARCSRGQGHVGVHAGHADDGTSCQWPERPVGSEEKTT